MGSPDSDITNKEIGTSFWISLSVAPLVLTAGLLGGWSGSHNTPCRSLLPRYSLPRFSAITSGGSLLPTFPLLPRYIAIFWAILNLGTLGGLAVSAAACLSCFSSYRGRRSEWTKTAFAELFAAGAAGSAYAAGVGLMPGFESFSGRFLVPTEVWPGSAAMVVGHFLATAVVDRFISPNDNDDSTWAAAAKLMVRSFGGRVIAAFSAILMLAAFRHFGYAFALVVVPADPARKHLLTGSTCCG